MNHTFSVTVKPLRMLGLRTAIAYAGISPAALGVRPVAMPGGRLLYDVRDLDAALDALKGGDAAQSDQDIIDRLG